jgi:transposase InsO family protein
LTADIIELARQYGRYGYRRITALLRRAGWMVNKKRVERIWRCEGLKVPLKQPKRGRLWLNDGSCIRLRPERPNHVWSYDFVADRTHDGKAFRKLKAILANSSSADFVLIPAYSSLRMSDRCARILPLTSSISTRKCSSFMGRIEQIRNDKSSR